LGWLFVYSYHCAECQFDLHPIDACPTSPATFNDTSDLTPFKTTSSTARFVAMSAMRTQLLGYTIVLNAGIDATISALKVTAMDL
jgi:hypothetical protein